MPSRRPLVWFTVCWVLGSAVAASQPLRSAALAGTALLAFLTALALLRRSTWPLAAACMAAFALASVQRAWTDARNVTALAAQYAEARAASPADAAEFEARLTGVIVSPPERDGDRVQFRVAGENVKLAEADSAAEGEPAALRDERALVLAASAELATKADSEGMPALQGERMLVQVKLANEGEIAQAAAWKRGQRVSVVGTLALPGERTNFGGFDYRSYLHGQRIHWVLGADGASAVQANGGAQWSTASLLQRMDAMRASLGKRMDALYGGIQAGYMKGLVLGISDDLDPETFRQFSQLGLTHILAISGLHVAVFLYVLGGLLRLLRLTRERMLLIMILAVPFYVLLAGASPSVIRSGIMAMLGLAAARMNMLKDGLHLLAAAALLMLLWDPYMLENVGFQLSFLVTAGLVLGSSPFRGLLPRGKKWWTTAAFDLLSVTIVAQASSLPLTIYYFNQLHLFSIAANLVLVPFISFVVMPLGGASLILDGMWHPLGALIAQVTAIGNAMTFGFVMKLASWRSFKLTWATPSPWWVAAYYSAMGLACHALRTLQNAKQAAAEAAEGTGEGTGDRAGTGTGSRTEFVFVGAATQPLTSQRAGTAQEVMTDGLAAGGLESTAAGWSAPFIEIPAISSSSLRRHRTLLGGAALGLAALLVGAYYSDALDRNGYVDFLDVGQGDAVYIRMPGGQNILVDGGGAVAFGAKEAWRQRQDPYEVGRKLVVPLLLRRGVHHLDLVVLSHLDSDHIKGLLAVLESIPVRAILWNGTVKDSADAVALLRMAVDQKVPLYRAEGGRNWSFDRDSSIRVIGSPPSLQAQLAETGESANDGHENESVIATGMTQLSPDSVPLAEEQNGESVALLIEMYGRRFLLTGDADAAEERGLLDQLQTMPSAVPAMEPQRNSHLAPPPLPKLPIDVMKISHHGSKTSTSEAWLAYWQPAWAVISLGRNNIYGHPHPSVVERLNQAGIPISRTDKDGEVQFKVGPDGGLTQRSALPSVLGPAL